MVDESNPVISRFTSKIKELINNKADKTNATQSDAGLMSAEDKIKLDAIDTQYSINVEKQSTADSGFFSTYVVKQNNTQKGVKINIPKDFLVKSATVKACTTANSPVSGYEVGDKYIDFVINSKDSTNTDEHLYLAAKEIGAYPVDEVTLTVANGKLAVKDNGVTWAKLATAVQNTINGKEDTSNKVNSVSANSTITQYPSAKCVYDTFCQGNDSRLSDRRNPKFIDIGGTSTNPKDLNNYTSGGFYYCDSDANAPYVSNCPLTSTRNKSFFLLVETWGESSNYVKQTLTYYNNQKTYIRTKVNATEWSSWYLVQTTNPHIPSTHTSSTSAWTGINSELASLTQGVVIYYFLRQQPTTSPVTLNLTLANGDTTGAKNVYLNSSTRLSNQYGINSMICLYYSGNEWFVINPYNDSIYIKNTDGAVLNANIGNNQVSNAKLSDNAVSTSKIQNGAVTNDKLAPITDNKLTYDSTVYNGLSPIDMSMIDTSNANRLAFMPVANIQVKVSTNGGSTWSDYPSITNDMKLKMVSKSPDESVNLYAGGITTASANNQIRIILDAGEITSSKNSDIYCSTGKKLMIAFTTNNASKTKVTVDMASYANPTTWVNAQTYNVGGWWGWNSIPFPYVFGGYQGQQNMSDHYRYIRLTFTHTGGSGNPIVRGIRLYTPISYLSPSNYAKYGHIYSYDTNQNVTFPAKIIKSGGTSSQFLKANGDVETLNTTPFTVTYTDGTTSTINFVTR